MHAGGSDEEVGKGSLQGQADPFDINVIELEGAGGRRLFGFLLLEERVEVEVSLLVHGDVQLCVSGKELVNIAVGQRHQGAAGNGGLFEGEDGFSTVGLHAKVKNAHEIPGGVDHESSDGSLPFGILSDEGSNVGFAWCAGGKKIGEDQQGSDRQEQLPQDTDSSCEGRCGSIQGHGNPLDALGRDPLSQGTPLRLVRGYPTSGCV